MPYPGHSLLGSYPSAETQCILQLQLSGLFANGRGDRGSIPGRDITKTQKLVLDATLLNTQHYKVGIKGKVKQSREWSIALPYTYV